LLTEFALQVSDLDNFTPDQFSYRTFAHIFVISPRGPLRRGDVSVKSGRT